jgi:hypothetical protein
MGRAPSPAVVVPIRPSLASAAVVAAAATALVPAPLRAWDEVGHQAIALVAWRAMSPATRARAVALLRAAPRDAGLAELRPSAGGPEARDRALFARAAAWPDYVKSRRDSLLAARSRRYNHPTWHYLNQYWQPGAGGWPQVVTWARAAARSPRDVVERHPPLLGHRRARGAGPRSAPWSSRGCMHLVGDLHQPLTRRLRSTPPYHRDRGGQRESPPGLHEPARLRDDALDTGRPRRGRGQRALVAPRRATAQAERVAAALAPPHAGDVVRASLAVTRPAVWRRGLAHLASTPPCTRA